MTDNSQAVKAPVSKILGTIPRLKKKNSEDMYFNMESMLKEVSPAKNLSWSDTTDKATWIASPSVKKRRANHRLLLINNNITLKIPYAIRELESVFLEGKYILDLKDDWDDEGAIGYTEQSWESGASFIIDFYKWLLSVFSGDLYFPMMHHGPKGTIDIAWDEDDFRLFINLDFINNKGSFYSDTPNKQYSEGDFLLNDFKFKMIPFPLKN
ncbi:hypothetical protein [uncultured Tenacibaculum sp.]|uniref:hypothetical protein n=1 Tax=uncultured Tenacibaculum sp. TaxID=174713 RepID=UPI002613A480|nr:hypothetical protein [uncultured Tenacibaculum sp.]